LRSSWLVWLMGQAYQTYCAVGQTGPKDTRAVAKPATIIHQGIAEQKAGQAPRNLPIIIDGLTVSFKRMPAA